MQGVQAGGDLHGLHHIHGLAVGVHHAAQLQGRPAARVVILDNQVLRLLGVDKGSGEGVLLGLEGVVVLEAVGSQHGLNLFVGPGGDLVDHGPGEGDLGAVQHVSFKARGSQAVGHPLLHILHHAGLDLVAVVGAVIHGLHRQGKLACLIPLQQQHGNLAHGQHGLQSPLQVGRVHAVALLGDGEGDHLQRRIAEDFHQPCPVGKLVVGLQALSDGGDDLLLDGAGGLQGDKQRQIVVGLIGLVDDLVVKALGHDDAPVILAGIQGLVQNGRGRPGRCCLRRSAPRWARRGSFSERPQCRRWASGSPFVPTRGKYRF